MSSTIFRPGETPDDAGVGASPDALRAMRQRIVGIPGVQSVAVSTDGAQPVTSSRGRGESIELPGAGFTTATERLHQLYVSADYLPTFGMPLIRGRAIDAGEDHPGSGAVMLNEAAADLLWPGENPIGKRLVRHAAGDSGATTTLEVIGVSGRAPYDGDESAPMVYAPLSTAATGWDAAIAVRTSGDARTYVPPIRAAIRELKPYAAIGDVITLAERYAGQRREALQSNAAAFAVGAAALLLASLGLYAIIAFSVVQRTREIGIRLAMGATSAAIVRHFFREGVVVATIGLGIGLPLTVAGILVVKASLIGFTLQGIATVVVVVPVLIVVAALASWLPARRAGRVDPMIALRSE
jgi:hypothetical protein